MILLISSWQGKVNHENLGSHFMKKIYTVFERKCYCLEDDTVKQYLLSLCRLSRPYSMYILHTRLFPLKEMHHHEGQETDGQCAPPKFGHVTSTPERKGSCVAMVSHGITPTPLTARETSLFMS